MVYICSPADNELNYNTNKEVIYCTYASSCNTIPIAARSIIDSLKKDQLLMEDAKKIDYELLKRCDEFWVFGNEITQEMQDRIGVAGALNIPTMYILDEFIEKNYKIQQNDRLLDLTDCVPDSSKEDYTDKILVLNPDTLIESARRPEKQLHLAYNGFGCSPSARGRAVYTKNLYTGQRNRWNREDFLGIAKEETIKEWMQTFPVKTDEIEKYLEQNFADEEYEI